VSPQLRPEQLVLFELFATRVLERRARRSTRAAKDEMTKTKADEWIIVEVGCKGLPYWVGWPKEGAGDWHDDPAEAGGYASESAARREIEADAAMFAGCVPRRRSEVLRG
jgi:hypothetical protein